MPIIDVSQSHDYIGEDLKYLNEQYDIILSVIGETLDRTTQRITENPNYSTQEFYDDYRIGTKAYLILEQFLQWRQILEQSAPDKITDRVKNSGNNVTINNDGSVTIIN